MHQPNSVGRELYMSKPERKTWNKVIGSLRHWTRQVSFYYLILLYYDSYFEWIEFCRCLVLMSATGTLFYKFTAEIQHDDQSVLTCVPCASIELLKHRISYQRYHVVQLQSLHVLQSEMNASYHWKRSLNSVIP